MKIGQIFNHPAYGQVVIMLLIGAGDLHGVTATAFVNGASRFCIKTFDNPDDAHLEFKHLSESQAHRLADGMAENIELLNGWVAQ